MRGHEPRAVRPEVKNGDVVRISPQSEIPIRHEYRTIRVVAPHATGELTRGFLAEPSLGSHGRQHDTRVWAQAREFVSRAARQLVAEFEGRQGARRRDELITPQPGEHNGRPAQPEPLGGCHPETFRRPVAPPIHIHRGSTGCQQAMRWAGETQLPHRQFGGARTSSGESDVPYR